MIVVDAMLGNAAIAAGLALLALGIALVVRRPAVRHALWLLVLLKLVTPPLISVPLPVLPTSWNSQLESNLPQSIVLSPASVAQPAADSSTSFAATRYWPVGSAEWLLTIWAAGSIGWFVWQGRKVLRFRRRVLRADDADPDLAEAASRIAARLGIRQEPAVKITTGIGSPMLWGWGRHAVVLFPRDLLSRLSPEARDTLVAHELAHFLRRDHWVRLLEFATTGLYWWHPAVWLARQGIESAEEECCDAWVVGGLAASPRRYAEALLATVDFEAELRRPCLPPTACAANRSARLLHRRLFGILHAGPPGKLRGAAAFWLLALAVLLARPVLRASSPDRQGEEPTNDSKVARIKRQAKSNPVARVAPRTIEARPWATAASPAGITVEAQERELVLHHPDGTTKVLGPGRPLALSFSSTTNRIATVGPGPLLRTWDEHGEPLAEARLDAAARAIAYTPDGSRLLVLSAEGAITIHDPQTLAVGYRWYVEGPANSISCSPDGQVVAISFGSWLSEKGWVECWSINDPHKVACMPSAAPVGATRFTPDGKTIIIGGWNGLVAWRSLPDGRFITDRQLSKDLVATAAFCPEAGSLPLVPPIEIAPPPVPVLQLDLESPRGMGQFTDR
jgi:beta-lactamase regulating signal transducer with metallopeptidase domain